MKFACLNKYIKLCGSQFCVGVLLMHKFVASVGVFKKARRRVAHSPCQRSSTLGLALGASLPAEAACNTRRTPACITH